MCSSRSRLLKGNLTAAMSCPPFTADSTQGGSDSVAYNILLVGKGSVHQALAPLEKGWRAYSFLEFLVLT